MKLWQDLQRTIPANQHGDPIAVIESEHPDIPDFVQPNPDLRAFHGKDNKWTSVRFPVDVRQDEQARVFGYLRRLSERQRVTA